MPDERQLPSGSPRRAVMAAAAVLIVVGSLVGVLAVRDKDEVAGSTGSQPSVTAPVPSSTPPTPTLSTELVDRLRAILKVRDQAFHTQNSRLLNEVYTVDCPCLEGDKNAIDELAKNNYRLVGGATSLRLQRAERVNDRLWLIIGDLQSAKLRIETKDNRLVREEPPGSDRFQFALSKPVGSSDWLLGRATPFRDG